MPMKQVTFPLSTDNVAEVVAERDAEIERLSAKWIAETRENERLRTEIESLQVTLVELNANKRLRLAD